MRKYKQPQPFIIHAFSRVFILLGISLLTLTGCGQRGDLYLPESTDNHAQPLPTAATEDSDVNSPALPMATPSSTVTIPDNQDY